MLQTVVSMLRETLSEWVDALRPSASRHRQKKLLRVNFSAPADGAGNPNSYYLDVKPGAKGARGFLSRLLAGRSAFASGVLFLAFVIAAGLLLKFLIAVTPSADQLLAQSQRGPVGQAFGSFFLFKMITDPQPLEILTVCLATPFVWRTMPHGWRMLFYPIVGQMMYITVSRLALIPTEFALMRILRDMLAALGGV